MNTLGNMQLFGLLAVAFELGVSFGVIIMGIVFRNKSE